MEAEKRNIYHFSRIYKLINSINDEIYIGSTTQPLSKRMSSHRSSAKVKKYLIYQKMNELGIENFRIILIENFKCESLEELRSREDFFIKNLKPAYNVYNAVFNLENSYQKNKEYRENNIDIEKARHKQYYEANKDKLLAQHKQYYEANRDKELARHKQYRENNLEKSYQKNKEYREINRDKELARHKEYRENNRDREKARAKKYREANKDKVREQNEKNNDIPIEMINDLFHYIV
jgi:hypothetical protein